MDIKNTKSYKNICDSFMNESKAIISYLIFADIATAEGNEEAAELFKKMARNEAEHAKTWFKYMHNMTNDTITNLKTALDTENSEWKTAYPEAARQATEEGLHEIAAMFERISSIECAHERSFAEMLLSQGQSVPDFKAEEVEEVSLCCLFCGFPSKTALDLCPVCGATGSFMA